MDDAAMGGLTQFQELFTIIPCVRKDLKPYYLYYLKTHFPNQENISQ